MGLEGAHPAAESGFTRRLWLNGPLCASSVHAHAHVGRNRAKGMYEYSEGRRAFGRHGRLNCLGREL